MCIITDYVYIILSKIFKVFVNLYFIYRVTQKMFRACYIGKNKENLLHKHWLEKAVFLAFLILFLFCFFTYNYNLQNKLYKNKCNKIISLENISFSFGTRMFYVMFSFLSIFSTRPERIFLFLREYVKQILKVQENVRKRKKTLLFLNLVKS